MNEDVWMDFAEPRIKNRVPRKIDWEVAGIYAAIAAGTSAFWIGVILWMVK